MTESTEAGPAHGGNDLRRRPAMTKRMMQLQALNPTRACLRSRRAGAIALQPSSSAASGRRTSRRSHSRTAKVRELPKSDRTVATPGAAIDTLRLGGRRGRLNVRLPEHEGLRVAVGSEPPVLGDKAHAVLDRGCVDQPVGRIAREGGWQRDGGGRDRRRKWEGSNLSRAARARSEWECSRRSARAWRARPARTR